MAARQLTAAILGTALLTGVVTASPAQPAWSPAQMLNDPSHTGDIKEPKLWGAANGGFHALYRHFPGGTVTVNYRRFEKGALRPNTVQVHSLGFLAGGEICEAGDGAIHIVWENWDKANEQIWWAKSSDGGLTFPVRQPISDYSNTPNGQAKNPLVIPYGAANSPEVLGLSWGARPTDALYYNRYNGTARGGHTAVDQRTSNAYAAWGAARDPRDGSVFRCYGVKLDGVWQIAYRRLNGSGWDPQQLASDHTNNFASRPAIADDYSPNCDLAADAQGHLYCVWEYWARAIKKPRAWFSALPGR